VERFRVNIVGLSIKVHPFEYTFGDEFFKQFGDNPISRGSFKADVAINKHETFLEVHFDIKGTAQLVCDRSLEVFDYPIAIKRMVVFKYGEEDREITEEVMMIHRDTVSLELGQFIYEFIALAVPMKKLHPRFEDEENDEDEIDEENGKIIFSSTTDEENKDEITDPRWDILKKLK
jgi:uncharacterized metal-binding protein YceD (DUF177 family)